MALVDIPFAVRREPPCPTNNLFIILLRVDSGAFPDVRGLGGYGTPQRLFGLLTPKVPVGDIKDKLNVWKN